MVPLKRTLKPSLEIFIQVPPTLGEMHNYVVSQNDVSLSLSRMQL